LDLRPEDSPPKGNVASLTGPRCTKWLPSVKRHEGLAIGNCVRFAKSYRPGMVFEKSGGARTRPRTLTRRVGTTRTIGTNSD